MITLFDLLPMLSRPILTIAVSLLLAACGGGGGTPVSNNPPDTQATPNLVIPTIPSSAPPIANIARARPRPGSVTQSSNVGEDGMTLDQITFDRTNFTISNGSRFSFTNPVDLIDVIDTDNYYLTNKLDEDHELTKRYSSYNFINYVNGIKGREFLWAFYRETDYLLLGYWTELDRTSTEETYSDIGAFVTGGDLFNDNKMPIEGEATYQGFGTVTGFEGDNLTFTNDDNKSRTNAFWILGDSSLSVDFGSGIISGKISNLQIEKVKANQIINENNLQDIPGELILNNAKIGNSNSGFFEGNLTGTFDGRSYNGLYGGQFYGNGESDGQPGTVAGTLGGISSDGRFTIIGQWFGDK